MRLHKNMDKVVQASVADLLINISAGWFAAAYGAVFLAGTGLLVKIGLLIIDAFIGIICLYIAIKLRRRIKDD